MINPEEIIDYFDDLSFGGKGLGCWLYEPHAAVEERLRSIDSHPLTKVQFNQLLVASELPSVSDGFFQYYWLEKPEHCYDLECVQGFDDNWLDNEQHSITSLQHLRWGLNRLYIDALLFFGNVNMGFKELRGMNYVQISDFFNRKAFDTEAISDRGPSLPLRQIAKDDRYLISEMACKSYGQLPESGSELQQALLKAYQDHRSNSGGPIKIRDLLDGSYIKNNHSGQQFGLKFSADDILEEEIYTEDQIIEHYARIETKFNAARQSALYNTDLYLSVVNDLDIYVATSMRSRSDFRQMADRCDAIFKSDKLKNLHLRYFDPTMSAADGHEDKGLIECLMVKCAKLLIYTAGEKESYGKDAEAAMALSLGKPVIFLCDPNTRSSFYKEVHPLSRLIDFRSGVAVGAIVTDNVDDVIEIVSRIFSNKMRYQIEKHPDRAGFIRLTEELTGSVVRVQTDNQLLTKTFWNNYHNRGTTRVLSLAAGKEAERLQE